MRPDFPGKGLFDHQGCAGLLAPWFAARTGDKILYAPGEPAFVLLDFDTKGMPPAVKARLAELGGFLEALHAICPGFDEAGYISRARQALASLTK